jgi:hypothetical protein
VSDESAQDNLESFNGVFHHVTDAWSRKDRPNILLVHYADLLHDLSGEMSRIASRLGIDVTSDRVDELARAATFKSMQDIRDRLAPDPAGALLDKSRVFRLGGSGAGTDVLGAEAAAGYRLRASQAASPDLVEWLHRG